MQFLIKTANRGYTGRSYGLPFTNGIAMLTQETLDMSLGRSVEEVAVRLHNTDGYNVEPQGDAAVEVWPSLLKPPKESGGRKSVMVRKEKTDK